MSMHSADVFLFPLPCICSSTGAEPGFLLLMDKTLELVARQRQQPPQQQLRYLNAIVPTLEVLAEDRAGTGVLGRVGLGRKSPLSVR